MGNCLVTKLKSAVDNDSLDRLGMLCLGIKAINSPTVDTQYRRLCVSDDVTSITISVSEGQIYRSYGGEGGSSLTFENISTDEVSGYKYINFYVPNIDCILYVPKYVCVGWITSYGFSIKTEKISSYVPIGALTDRLNLLEGRLAELPTSLTYLQVSNTKLEGSLEDFGRFDMTYIVLGDNYGGDIATLGGQIHLTTLWAGKLTGNIEDFVIAQRAAGRTECTGISTRYFGASNNLYFNNELISYSGSIVTLSWTASTITFGETTINA